MWTKSGSKSMATLRRDSIASRRPPRMSPTNRRNGQSTSQRMNRAISTGRWVFTTLYYSDSMHWAAKGEQTHGQENEEQGQVDGSRRSGWINSRQSGSQGAQ